MWVVDWVWKERGQGRVCAKWKARKGIPNAHATCLQMNATHMLVVVIHSGGYSLGCSLNASFLHCFATEFSLSLFRMAIFPSAL